MPSRRSFMAATAAAGSLLSAPGRLAAAWATPDPVKGATAITEVFGDGLKLVAIAIEYDGLVDGSKLSPASFRVEGRTVTAVHASASPSAGEPASAGPYVVVALSPDDPTASLAEAGPGGMGGPPGASSPGHDGPPPGGPGGGGKGPPHFGPRQIFKPAAATVIQTGPVVATDGRTYPPGGSAIQTTSVINPIVDDFRQLEHRDPKTGRTLAYNLFVPKGYDGSRSYPLVLFMHDAGTLSRDPTTTLKQGLGAVVWASPADQARRPAFVLAPQYAEVAVDDASSATGALQTTLDLVEAVASQYNVDRTRLYATGQSMGAMMSIAMDIAHPDLFAATFVVAGQWDPAKVAPLAKQKLWIVVSQGDLKAYPGENAITAALEHEGASVGRAVWDGRSTPEQFAASLARLEAEGYPINYVALERGTVVPPGQRDDGGSNHVNTWRIGYTIEGIRAWIFDQRR